MPPWRFKSVNFIRRNTKTRSAPAAQAWRSAVSDRGGRRWVVGLFAFSPSLRGAERRSNPAGLRRVLRVGGHARRAGLATTKQTDPPPRAGSLCRRCRCCLDSRRELEAAVFGNWRRDALVPVGLQAKGRVRNAAVRVGSRRPPKNRVQRGVLCRITRRIETLSAPVLLCSPSRRRALA